MIVLSTYSFWKQNLLKYMPYGLMSTSLFLTFRLCNFGQLTIEERMDLIVQANNYVRFGMMMIIFCILIFSGNLCPCKRTCLGLAHAIIVPVCFLTGQHLDISEITFKNSFLTYMYLGGGFLFISYFLNHIQLSNDEFIFEMSAKIDS